MKSLFAVIAVALVASPMASRCLGQDEDDFPFGPPDRTHAITVSGRALDEAGQPVTGASVRLLSVNGADVELGSVVTEADGRFRFVDAPLPIFDRQPPSISSGTFMLLATCPGRGFGWCGHRFVMPEPRHKDVAYPQPDKSFYLGEPIAIDVVLARPARLAGRVLDPDGDPLPGATVTVGDCNPLERALTGDENTERFWGGAFLPPSVMQITTGPDGGFALDGLPSEALFGLVVEHERWPKLFVHAATTEKRGIERRNPLDGTRQPVLTGALAIRLPRGESVRVRVVSASDERPIEGVLVYAAPLGAGVSPGMEETDAEGLATLNVPVGRYRLVLRPPANLDFVEIDQEISVGADSAESPVTLRLERFCELTLEAVDAKTELGVAGLSFREETDGGRSWRMAERGVTSATVTDADGRLVLRVRPGKRRYRFDGATGDDAYGRLTSPPIDLPAGQRVTHRFRLTHDDEPEAPPATEPSEEKWARDDDFRGRQIIVVKPFDEAKEPAAQLPPGARPGTFRFTHSGRVSWTAEPAFPVEIGIRPQSEDDLRSPVRLERDEEFAIAIDLEPGSHSLESRLLNASAPRRYWDAIGIYFDISSSGEMRIRGGRDLVHDLVVHFREPGIMGLVREDRPLVRWDPIPDAIRYSVACHEKDPVSDEAVRRMPSVACQSPEYRFATPLTAGHSYEVDVQAMNAAGESIAHGNSYFVVAEPGIEPLGLEPRLVGRFAADEGGWFEFSADGALTVSIQGDAHSGRYEFIRPGILYLTIGDADRGPFPFRFESDDVMVVGGGPDGGLKLSRVEK